MAHPENGNSGKEAHLTVTKPVSGFQKKPDSKESAQLHRLSSKLEYRM